MLPTRALSWQDNRRRQEPEPVSLLALSLINGEPDKRGPMS